MFPLVSVISNCMVIRSIIQRIKSIMHMSGTNDNKLMCNGIITRYIDEPLYVLDALEGRTGTRSDYYGHRMPADTDDTMKYRVEGEMALNPGECYTVDIEHDNYGNIPSRSAPVNWRLRTGGGTQAHCPPV